MNWALIIDTALIDCNANRNLNILKTWSSLVNRPKMSDVNHAIGQFRDVSFPE
jgi:hypothetical protein